MAEVGVRDYLAGLGYNVGYNDKSGNVMVDGKDIDSSGFRMGNDNRYYGDTESIIQRLSSAPKGTVPVRQNLEALGYKVGYNPMTGNASANGLEFDSSKMANVGGRLYANPNQISSVMRNLPFQGNNQQSVQDIISKLQNNNFSYNPNKDRALQQAQKQAQMSVSNEMMDRGILNSTVTADRASQATAALVPQYEQMAYQKYQDENNRMMNLANTMAAMDDRQYGQFKDRLDMQFQDRQMQFQEEQAKVQNERAKIADALNKINTLGYADNDTAAALGVPVGTLSGQAQEAANQRKQQLDMYSKQVEDQRKDAETQFGRQKELMSVEDQQRRGQMQLQNTMDLQKMGLQNQFNVEQFNRELSGQKDLAGMNNALAWAKYGYETDPNSLENKYKQAQIDALNGKNANGGINLDDISATLTKMYIDPQDGSIRDTNALRNHIISLNLPDPQTDTLLRRYGLPTN